MIIVEPYVGRNVFEEGENDQRIQNVVRLADHGLELSVELFGRAEGLDVLLDDLRLFDDLELVVHDFEDAALLDNALRSEMSSQ